MRVTVDVKNEEGNDDPAYGQHDVFDVRVFLNDVEQSGVVIADEEQGYVTRFQRGNDGNYFIRNDRMARETLRGTVRIEPRVWAIRKRRR